MQLLFQIKYQQQSFISTLFRQSTAVYLQSKMSTTSTLPHCPFRAIILDIDGTLIDSNDAHARAFEQAFHDCGHIYPYEDIRRLIGMGGDNLLPHLSNIKPDSVEGEEINNKKKEYFSQEMKSLKPQPGAKELVKALHDRGFLLGISSSCKASELGEFLELIGIEKRYLDACTTSDDIDSSKPDPDAVQATLKKLKVDPEEAVMIGDTPYDVESAGKSGVKTIIFRCGGYWSDKNFPTALALYDSPQDLLNRMADSPLAGSPAPSS